MSNSIINKGALLREQRLFPQEAQALSVEIDRSYVEIAAKMNDRTIGLFPTNTAAINGEKWSIDGQTYSGFRQIYDITTFPAAGATSTYPSNIQIQNVYAFTNIYGTIRNSLNQWGSLSNVSVTSNTDNIALFVTPNGGGVFYDIGLSIGATVASTWTRALIVLEWIGQA